MEAIDEIVAEFLVESHENLDQLDRDLLALEQNPGSRELLASIFRTIHTIKGTSGFLAYHRLEKLTHVGENLLSRLRDGKIQLTDERASSLLKMVDAIRGLLAAIEQTGSEGDGDFSELADDLARLLEDAPAVPVPAQPAAAEAQADEAEPGETAETAEDDADDAGDADDADETEGAAEAEADDADAADVADAPVAAAATPADAPPLGQVMVEHGTASPTNVEIAALEQKLGDQRPIGQILVAQGSATPAAVETALESQDSRRSVVDSSVRVDVELLDSLMRMVGELVLARNQLVSRLGDAEETAKDTGLARSAQRLSLVTSELQEQVMKTRMQPVDSVWSKLPRVVRDLAKQCGRMVRLEMEGRETELDRSVLEAIKDPLTHLVRNAVDHGIEPPEVRTAAGKTAEGLLRLRAYHEAGQVHLEIIDDGAGIDPAKLGAKAVERGLVTAQQLESMSTRDIHHLIFLPGFSTAGAVTNVSGRGVGMDVVKTRIEAIGGAVDVSSRLGKGSTIRLTIPLTLAIIPALTIGCASRRYAVPQVSVLELVRLSGEHARGGIELISGAPVYRLRDMLLPLVYLDEQLGLVPGHSEHETEPKDREAGEPGKNGPERGGFIVVLHAEQQRFGLVVDDVLDTQEIVVKPLGRHLKGIPAYAGATILGDGAVVLILDAATLARRANVLAATTGAVTETRTEEVEVVDPVLVVDVGGSRQAAIPLDKVTRLEEIPLSSIEHVGGREVVQYRGHIMPLCRLSTLLGAYGEGSGGDTVQLVVYTRGDRSVGFVVDRILDIASERLGTRSDIDDHALLGSVVVGDKVVELLDVQAAVLSADPGFFAGEGYETEGAYSADFEGAVS
jgi:two-component system, chemotaxis family, sensor kinase CheA